MRLILLLLLGIASISVAQPTEQKVSSEIKNVTVFLKGAEITRAFKTALTSGKSTIVISQLPAHINENSIQVRSGSEDVRVLAVSSRLNYLTEKDKPMEIQKLVSRKEILLDEIKEMNSWVEVYEEEEGLLKSNKSIGGDQNGVKIDELKQAADYFRERLADIKSKQLLYKKKIQELSKELKFLENQLTELNNKKEEPVRELIVKVNAKRPVSTTFDVGYTVKEAGWLPSYDIRAMDVKSPITVMYKANVFQNSGEDWKNVKLTFSNADPSSSGSAPSLATWYLDFNNYYQDVDGPSG